MSNDIIQILVTKEEFTDMLDSYFCDSGNCSGDCYRDVVEDRSECIWDAITMNLPDYTELERKYKEIQEYVSRLEKLGLSAALESDWNQSEFESALNKIRNGTYLDSEIVESLNYRIGRWQRDYIDLENKQKKQVSELNDQIRLLKDACRHYCRKSVWLDHADRSMEDAIRAADEKLSRKMPGIFGDEENYERNC